MRYRDGRWYASHNVRAPTWLKYAKVVYEFRHRKKGEKKIAEQSGRPGSWGSVGNGSRGSTFVATDGFRSRLPPTPPRYRRDRRWRRYSARPRPSARNAVQSPRPPSARRSGSSPCLRPTTPAPIRWTAWCGTWTGWADGRPPGKGRPPARWPRGPWPGTRAPAPAGSRRVPFRSTRRTTVACTGPVPRPSACTRWCLRWPPPWSRSPGCEIRSKITKSTTTATAI